MKASSTTVFNMLCVDVRETAVASESKELSGYLGRRGEKSRDFGRAKELFSGVIG